MNYQELEALVGPIDRGAFAPGIQFKSDLGRTPRKTGPPKGCAAPDRIGYRRKTEAKGQKPLPSTPSLHTS